MAIDIAYTLFVEILRMQDYPGGSFSGDPVKDIVMFFFIPTVFIILFIFMLLGTMFPRGWPLRALTGIAIWLFIVFGGYYGTFAMLAGPYFFVLIFILGAIFFLRGHIGARVGGAVPGLGGGGGGGGKFSHMSTADLVELLGTYSDQLKEGMKHNEPRLSELRAEVAEISAELSRRRRKIGKTESEAVKAMLHRVGMKW
jgi:hypothetical protein